MRTSLRCMGEEASSKPSLYWQLAFGLLGASAGLTFVLYVVGDFVEARRFDTLKLPGAQTVAPLSHDSLVAVGGRTLLPPLLGALGTAALFAVLVAASRVRPRNDAAVVAAVLGAVAAAAIALAALGVGAWENAGFVLLVEAVAWAGWARFRQAHRQEDPVIPAARIAGLGAFVVACIIATVVLVQVWRPPAHLEYANVKLRHGGHECGIYLALTSDDVYLAPALPGHHGSYRTLRRIVALPRADVQMIILWRKTPVRDAGADDAAASKNPACARS